MRSSPPRRFSRPDRFASLGFRISTLLTDWIFIDSLCDVTFPGPTSDQAYTMGKQIGMCSLPLWAFPPGQGVKFWSCLRNSAHMR